jgi:uncharacterized membrane-anchored protein
MKYIAAVKSTSKGKLVEAVIYAEEGFARSDEKLMQKAFNLAPELVKNAIHYADCLIKKNEYRSARKVLLKSFKHVQVYDLYEKYINCRENITDSDRIAFAEKVVAEVSDSWMAYFELANIAMRNDMMSLAFRNFLEAYNIKAYDFIVDKLIESAKMLSEPKPQEAVDVLAGTLKSQRVEFIWKCRHCGRQEKQWAVLCEQCGRIAECAYTEQVVDERRFLPTVISDESSF